MPPVSQAQRKAMFAAASGKSTLGIPKKVGREFAAADMGGILPQKKRRNYAKGGAVDCESLKSDPTAYQECLNANTMGQSGTETEPPPPASGE